MSNDGDPEFPRRFYTRGLEPKPVKSINYYFNSPVLFRKLKRVLHEDEWAEISDSPLGVFLRYVDLNFGWASRLVHWMLSFQIECNKKYEIWSAVKHNPCRFSLNEFEAITGLNCEYIEALEPEVPLTKEAEVFWGKLGVNTESGPTTRELIKACDVAAAWPRADRIRLGYLAIYVGMVEARSPGSPTRVNLARLVMDLPRFLEYPWGRLTFKNVINAVKSVDLAKSYTLEGFLPVLQSWVYYAMPELAAAYGEPITPDVPGRPLLLSYQGSKGRKNFKSVILDQTRFNHLELKEREEMSPLWDDGDDEDDEDEDDDEKVDALIGAFLGDYSKGPWKWSKRDFADEGFKVSNVTEKRMKVDDVVEGKGKKRAREESDEEDDEVEDVAPVMGDVKRHFDKCLGVLTAEMLNGFHRMDQNFKALSDQVNTLEHKVNKLRKRQRTGTVGQQQAAIDAADEDGGVTPKKDTAKLTPPKETSPPKPSPTVTPPKESPPKDTSPPKESPPKDTSPKKPSPTVTPPKESPPKQTSQKETSPKGHPAEEDVNQDADMEARVAADKGKDLEGKPADQMLYEDSSSSVQNYATDPSVEEVFVPTDKVKQMQRSILKQEVKKDAALKEIRAKQVRIKFGERSDKPPLGTGQSSRVAPPKAPGRGYDPFAPVARAKAAALMDFQKEE